MSRDLQIIRVDPDTRIVSIEIPNPPRFIEGIFALVQWICLELYQTQGTQIFDPAAGASLERFLGLAPSESEIQNTQMDIAVVLSQVGERIKRRQTNETLSADERLSDLSLEVINFNREEQAWEVEVAVTAESGRQARFDVATVVFNRE